MKRPNFFAGQILTATDLMAEQEYILERLRRHNRFLHGYGVVCGLWVRCADESEGEITIEPGYAIDPCGNEIFVGGTGCRCNLRELCRPATPEAGGQLYLALRYSPCPVDPVPVAGTPSSTEGGEMQASRVADGFEVGCLRALPESHQWGLGRRSRDGKQPIPCPQPPPDGWVVLAKVSLAERVVRISNRYRLPVSGH